MKKLILVIMFFIFIPVVEGALNPAQVYCSTLGYKYTVKNGQGLCILPDKTEVDAWKFLQGKVGINYSYCKLHGLEIKTVRNPKICIRFLLDECAVCVLKNGTEVEVTKLMNLSFEETTCGDGVCGIPENYKTCQKDCPSGSYDGYCDGIADGKCDRDCIDQGIFEKDPDCAPPIPATIPPIPNQTIPNIPPTVPNISVCNNNSICEKGENYENCPHDCPKPSVCGNKKCEPKENQTNCCKDCGCPSGLKCINNKCLPCGNKKCDVTKGENYKTCPKDCPSGSKDNYCDGLEDGKCDPDCKELKEFDPDCIPRNNLWIYFLLGGIAIFIGSIYYETKKKSKESASGETYFQP